jgi:arylsulfatase A-like enzyme
MMRMKNSTAKPNIIVLMVDDLRADCVGASGDRRFVEKYRCADLLETPAMDSLAESGVYFTQAMTCASNTPPSVAAMFTGCRGPVNGVRSLFGGPKNPQVRTLWEHLSAAGYDTAACDPHGFSEFNGTLDGCARVYHSNWSKERHTALLKTLSQELKPPFAAYLHLWDAHVPYGAGAYPYGLHKPFVHYLEQTLRDFFLLEPNTTLEHTDIEKLRETWMDIWHKHWNRGACNPLEAQIPQYVQGVTAFDKGRLASILKGFYRFGMLDNTILVLISDHGETVNCMNCSVEPLFQHSCFPNDGLMHIPFIIKAPGIVPSGKTITRQVSTADLVPTLLDLCGVSAQPGHAMDGRSLLPLIRGEDDSDSLAYCEHCAVAPQYLVPQFQNACTDAKRNLEFEWAVMYRTLRTPQYKYTESGEPLTERDKQAEPYKFVRALNRKVMLQWDDETELRKRIQALESGEVTRETMLTNAALQVRTAMHERLYDLQADPDEQVNLMGLDREKYWPVARPLKEELDRIHRGTLVPQSEKTVFEEKTAGEVDELAKHLRGLGYID